VSSSTVNVTVKPDTTQIAAAARVIARHLNAMADELDALAGTTTQQETAV
jgi:hypothetical protein